MKKNIILLHGLWESERLLRPISRRLEKIGYRTHLIDYSTTDINLNDLFSSIDEVVLSLDGEEVNFLGHSLGGLMIRMYFDYCGDVFNSKVITLGTPHSGSHAAKLANRIGLKRIFGNAYDIAISGNNINESWIHNSKLGSISGNYPKGIIQFLPHNFFREHDGMVLVKETKLNGMSDHVVTASSHIDMLYKKSVFLEIQSFLEQGKFTQSP